MFDDKDYGYIFDATVYDSAGEKVGSVGNLYLDDKTGEPSWLTVNTGLFGMSESFVPIDGTLQAVDGRIDVPYTKEQIKDAPRVDADGHLDPSEERELYAHFNRDWGTDDDVVVDRDRDLTDDVVVDRDRDLTDDVVVDNDRDMKDGVFVDRDQDLASGVALDTDRNLDFDDTRTGTVDRDSDLSAGVDVDSGLGLDRDVDHVVDDTDRDFGRDGVVTDAPVDHDRVVEADDVDRDTGLSLDRDRHADLRGDLGHDDADGNVVGDGWTEGRDSQVADTDDWSQGHENVNADDGGLLDEHGNIRSDEYGSGQHRLRRYNRPTF